LVISGNRRSRHPNIGLLGVALASALTASACVRDPLPSTCPELAAGDLVVTEIRGKQAGSYRQWIELYNATDAAIPVAGLRVTLTYLNNDGSETIKSFFVRDEALELPAAGYLVLGSGDPADVDYIDYDYSADQPSDLAPGATLELTACRALVDTLFFASLPEAGTLALDGAASPSAAANDDTDAGWCVDDRISEGPQTQIGIRGTPGEANPPCP